MNQRHMKPVFGVLACLLASGFVTSHAGDVAIPNEFSAGTPAVAAEVNDNFAAVEGAVNDNDARIDDLVARVEALEAQPALTVDTYYATDLVFLRADGDLVVAAIAGNQSPPGTIGTGIDWHALPGLSEVAFTVEEDDTVVVFQTNGEAYMGEWNAYGGLSVALRINGVIPEQGAMQHYRPVTDDNLAGGGTAWYLLHAATLPAGEHTFSVMVKVLSSQNQSSFTIEGRSGSGYEGLVKTTVMQVH